MNTEKLLAAGVHAYTSLGAVLAFVAFLALREQNVRVFLVALWIAVIVDSTDGLLARRFRVTKVLPGFNGRRLDDIIDYITYAFLPCLGFVEFGILPGKFAFLAVLPLLASAFGFSREQAKTEDAFVGFPSYWNLVFLYLYLLRPPTGAAIGVLMVLSILVFVPTQYLYPTRTQRLRRVNLVLAGLYLAVIGYLSLFPDSREAGTIAWLSLVYPFYYMAVSLSRPRKQIDHGL